MHTYLKCAFLALLFVHFTSGFAQSGNYIEAVNTGYLGHMAVHPGVFASADIRLREKFKIKERKKGEKIIEKSWLAVPSAAFYHHVRNQNVFIVGGDIERRRNKSKPLYHEWGMGPRLVAGFNAGETFTILASGEIVRKRLAASYNFGWNTSYAIGRYFKTGEGTSWAIYLSPQVVWMFGYNNTLAPNLNFVLGVKRTDIKGFRKS